MDRMNSIAEEREPLGDMSNCGEARNDEQELEYDKNTTCEDTAKLRRRSPHKCEKLADLPGDHFRTPLTSNRSSSRLGTPSNRRSSKLSTSNRFISLRAAFSPPKQFTSFMSPRQNHRNQSSRRKRTPESGNRTSVDDDKTTQEQHPDVSGYRGPTRLHDACFRAKSAKQLQCATEYFPQSDSGVDLNESFSRMSAAAATKDSDGRLPLHLISQNKNLSSALLKAEVNDSSNGSNGDTGIKSVVHTVLNLILEANPTAIVEKDNEGHIPFECALVEWIDNVHDSNLRGGLQKIGSTNSLGTQLENSIQQVVNTSISVSRAALARAGRSLQKSSTFSNAQSSDQSYPAENDGSCMIETSKPNDTSSPKSSSDVIEEGTCVMKLDDKAEHTSIFPQDAIGIDTSKPMRGKGKNNDARDSKFPLNARISAHAEFSLHILSAVLGKLENDAMEEEKTISMEISSRNEEASRSGETRSAITRHLLIDTIASIPNLVKTLLLVDDEEERTRLFEFPVVRRAMLSKRAVGRWLTFMLQSHNKMVSNRAVDYLQLLSDVSEEDQNKTHDAFATDPKRKRTNRDELPEAVRALEDLIPSMLALDEKTMEQAATTPIIRRVLDKMITRPFAVSVVFFDSLFLAILIVSFRGSVSTFLSGSKPETVMKYIYVANAMIFYFIVREFGKAVSLSTITKIWMRFFWGFWNIVDILSIIMALSSTIAIRINLSDNPVLDESSSNLRRCLAITTGLLWLKVLGLLKTINMQLATFVLAIVQITRDILWFLLILFAAVVSFAQMFYTLLLPPSCARSDAGKDSSHCSPAEYYLSVYSILLGDFGTFDRDDFYTVFSVILFVLFSFMVVIVLLNVLIAIVSDSYEKCLLRSQLLFGRARVMLLAELVSFQNLLRNNEGSQEDGHEPDTRIPHHWWTRQRCKGYTLGGFIFVALSVSVILLLFIAEMAGYATGHHYGNVKFSFFSIFVNVFILVAIVAFLSQGPGGMTDSAMWSNDKFRCCTCWYTNSIQKIMLRLLGTSEETSFAANDVEEWRGRINYIQGEITRISAESTAQTTAEVKALEKEVRSSDSRIRGELKALESRILQSEATIMASIKTSERLIETMIRDTQSAKRESGVVQSTNQN